MTQLRGFYLEKIKSSRDTPNEEMFEMLEELDEDNTEEAEKILSNLVEGNTGLIHYIINRRWNNINSFCSTYKITYDELFSMGTYALWKSVLTFDILKGWKFATYATRIIHNEFNIFIRKNKRIINDSSFENSLHIDIDGNELTLLDVMPDDNDEFEELVTNEFNSYFLEKFNKSLSERESNIIKLYYYGDLTELEISKILGISQSYVSRIKSRILEKGKKFYRTFDKIS